MHGNSQATADDPDIDAEAALAYSAVYQPSGKTGTAASTGWDGYKSYPTPPESTTANGITHLTVDVNDATKAFLLVTLCVDADVFADKSYGNPNDASSASSLADVSVTIGQPVIQLPPSPE